MPRFTDCGRTERRHVQVTDIIHIGKEANRWEEQLFLGVDDDAAIEYGVDPNVATALFDRLMAAIGKFGKQQVASRIAVGTSARRSLDALANVISTVPPAKLGLVLTTSVAPPRWLKLPHGYQFLDFREIARAENDRLAIDKNKLLGWIKGLRKGLDKPARLRAGRPSDATLVHEIFQERRAQALPLVNQRTEAEKIRAEIALRHPERDPPAGKTIESHLSRISNGLRGAVRQAAAP